MADEVTAKIVIEESGGGNRNPAQVRERDAVQKDIGKKLKPVSDFFGGGQGAALAGGVGILGKAFGVGGAALNALLGLGTFGFATDRATDIVRGMDIAGETKEEQENREKLNDEIEKGDVQMSTLVDTAKDTNKALTDMTDAGENMWQKFLDRDWEGMRTNFGEFIGNLFQASEGILNFNRALRDTDADRLTGQTSGGRSMMSPASIISREQNVSFMRQEDQITSSTSGIPFSTPKATVELVSSSLKTFSKQVGSVAQSLFYP